MAVSRRYIRYSPVTPAECSPDIVREIEDMEPLADVYARLLHAVWEREELERELDRLRREYWAARRGRP